MTSIFDSVVLGGHILPNRFVMAPMTRSRAQPDGTPGALAAQYYAQRAGVGLIIAEGAQPSADGQGYIATPGIYTQAHIDGWCQVTDAVHQKNGRIYIQLMHAGRMSHPDNTPHHRIGLAPSAISPESQIFTPTGLQDIPTPHAMDLENIRKTIEEFRFAARCAIKAGADGVEIHGANAYLIHQFLAESSNVRTDQYGGSLENRARFALEVAKAIADEIGADKTGIRLSPGMKLWGIDEGQYGPDLYNYLTTELNKLGLSYLHIMHLGDDNMLSDIRKNWTGNLILNRPGKERSLIGQDIELGLADLESYGAMILANPDFVKRIELNIELNEPDHSTYFGGNEIGYTDYKEYS